MDTAQHAQLHCSFQNTLMASMYGTKQIRKETDPQHQNIAELDYINTLNNLPQKLFF